MAMIVMMIIVLTTEQATHPGDSHMGGGASAIYQAVESQLIQGTFTNPALGTIIVEKEKVKSLP